MNCFRFDFSAREYFSTRIKNCCQTTFVKGIVNQLFKLRQRNITKLFGNATLIRNDHPEELVAFGVLTLARFKELWEKMQPFSRFTSFRSSALTSAASDNIRLR